MLNFNGDSWTIDSWHCHHAWTIGIWFKSEATSKIETKQINDRKDEIVVIHGPERSTHTDIWVTSGGIGKVDFAVLLITNIWFMLVWIIQSISKQIDCSNLWEWQ